MVRVSAGVIVRHGEVLACQRRATGRHPLKWEFPGGKVELGETSAECLHRELGEELGIAADIGRELSCLHHHYPDQEPVELRFFLVSGFRGVVTNHVFAEVRWTALAELAHLDFLDGDREFIAQLARGEINIT